MRGVLLRRPVVSWALYDWANSAFATTVMAGFFPVYFRQYWNAGVDGAEITWRLGLTNGVASLAIALLAPLVGAVADRAGKRVQLLALFTVLGAAMTAALHLVGQGEWLAAALLYLGASLGFWHGNQFYDSLLTDVADAPEYELVSAYGFALGYLGGGLLFALNVAMVANPGAFGFAGPGEAVRFAFLTVAAWWLAFAAPAVLFVRERRLRAPLPAAAAVRAGFVEIAGTVRYIVADRTILWFLLAYWFYIDGVNTIIKMAVDYGLALGFDQSALLKALLLTQFVAFPAALAFGWLGGRIGAKAGIYVALAVYTGATLYAYFLSREADFYALAVVIGLVQGGIQSLSRALYGRLIPAGRAGEFFGFYNMMGKAAAILGPLLAGVVAYATRDPRLSIVSIAALFVIGAAFLGRVKLAPETAGLRSRPASAP